MNIKLKVAQPHENQLKDQDLKREFDEIQALVNQFEYKEDTINLAVIKGIYKHIERRMTTACVFINKIGYPIKELHGELRLRLKENTALIAKATIDFDDAFMDTEVYNLGLTFSYPESDCTAHTSGPSPQ